MGVAFTPHPYQKAAAQFLLTRQHAGLLLPVGLGKSSIALMATLALRRAGHITRTLVVAPLLAVEVSWPDEIRKWTEFGGLTVKNLHAGEIGGDLEFVNPESLKIVLKKYPGRWDHLIVDESTAFKNGSSVRFKALRHVIHHFKRRWILTGSPSPNGLIDIWAQAFILDRGAALGKFITHFRREYCEVDHSGYKYKVRESAVAQIYEKLRPLMYRVDPKDTGLKLPGLLNNKITVRLPDDARATYNQMEQEFFIIVAGEGIASVNAAVAGGRCRQIANGAIYHEDHRATVLHREKGAALRRLVDEQMGAPLLVFYEFQHDIVGINNAIGEGHPVPNLTTAKDPNAMVAAWNRGELPVMIGHPQSIGKALNLQGSCAAVCFYGTPWALDTYEQGIGRVQRQGNTADTVVAHHLIAENTMDETVMEALASKAATQDGLNEALTRRGEKNGDTA